MSELAPSLRYTTVRPEAGHNRYPLRLIISLGVCILVLGWALWPTLFTGIDPLLGNPAQSLQPPSLAHWFGTDHLGRDLYSRTVHGTALSLSATSMAVLVALVHLVERMAPAVPAGWVGEEPAGSRARARSHPRAWDH